MNDCDVCDVIVMCLSGELCKKLLQDVNRHRGTSFGCDLFILCLSFSPLLSVCRAPRVVQLSLPHEGL